jgi:hypothetical protein
MNMNAQSEEMAREVHAARLARVNIQRMRLLAAQRAERLERELKTAAEIGLRAEISRGVEARSRLQTVAKRKRAARYAGVGAFAAVLCAATLGLAWNPALTAAVPGPTASHAPVLTATPGDRLKLALSYSVSAPAAR